MTKAEELIDSIELIEDCNCTGSYEDQGKPCQYHPVIPKAKELVRSALPDIQREAFEAGYEAGMFCPVDVPITENLREKRTAYLEQEAEEPNPRACKESSLVAWGTHLLSETDIEAEEVG